ncbi:MAG: hypothetical protein IJP48_02620 [Synergistaceae bacterium]|nr:hypothetical protein [Synergistaceae bacterium]
MHIVDYLLLHYGWRHKEAGKKYPESEKSFRQTLCYRQPTLGNCFYITADVKKESVEYFYRYSDIAQLSGFTLERFLLNIRERNIFIDFDARSGHNHGTKFRIMQNAIPLLYENVKYI